MTNPQEFFSRQVRLQQLDLERLRASSAMVIGLGNVGGPLGLELARAGVGRLILVDKDMVEGVNLSRGIFEEADKGMPKAVAAAARIKARVPGVDVTPLVADSRVDLPETLFSSCDALLIAPDSWSSRMHANRWAHALPGKTRIVVSGGIRDGVSWDLISSAPGSQGGCAQCPHGLEIAESDEDGGCGLIGPPSSPRADPSVSFIGAEVAMCMVKEACFALGGDGPLFAGQMLSFDFGLRRYLTLDIALDPLCQGHRRLREGEDYVVVPANDVRIRDLAGWVASAVGVLPSEVAFTTEREMLRSRTCRGCGESTEFNRPVISLDGATGRPCRRCGATEWAFDVGTELRDSRRTLAECGVPPGKAVRAHMRGQTLIVIRRNEVNRDEQSKS